MFQYIQTSYDVHWPSFVFNDSEALMPYEQDIKQLYQRDVPLGKVDFWLCCAEKYFRSLGVYVLKHQELLSVTQPQGLLHTAPIIKEFAKPGSEVILTFLHVFQSP